MSEVAQLLKRSERTIARDKAALGEELALRHDPKFGGVLAGGLVQEAERSIARIRRVTREPDCPHQTKVDGEAKCFGIFGELVTKLQSLGFAPSTAQRIEADVNHHVDLNLSLEEMGQELERVKHIESQARLSAAAPAST